MRSRDRVHQRVTRYVGLRESGHKCIRLWSRTVDEEPRHSRVRSSLFASAFRSGDGASSFELQRPRPKKITITFDEGGLQT